MITSKKTFTDPSVDDEILRTKSEFTKRKGLDITRRAIVLIRTRFRLIAVG